MTDIFVSLYAKLLRSAIRAKHGSWGIERERDRILEWLLGVFAWRKLYMGVPVGAVDRQEAYI